MKRISRHIYIGPHIEPLVKYRLSASPRADMRPRARYAVRYKICRDISSKYIYLYIYIYIYIYIKFSKAVRSTCLRAYWVFQSMPGLLFLWYSDDCSSTIVPKDAPDMVFNCVLPRVHIAVGQPIHDLSLTQLRLEVC